MDEQTDDRQKLHAKVPHAKAGATKIGFLKELHTVNSSILQKAESHLLVSVININKLKIHVTTKPLDNDDMM